MLLPIGLDQMQMRRLVQWIDLKKVIRYGPFDLPKLLGEIRPEFGGFAGVLNRAKNENINPAKKLINSPSY